MPITNATCFTKHAPFEGPPLIQNGQLTFQAHHVGWIITFFFTMVASITSFWLISKHLRWYTQKRQQRYIVRLLLMVPIYATVSFASYIFWNHAIPITLARDSYEALVLYSFFYLLLQYLSPTLEGQKEVFRSVSIKKWMFPLGFLKYRPEDGLYFLQLMKWGVLQYCVVRPTTTLAAVILDTVGLYCEDSWGPGWGHIYITVIVSLSVSVAMYCLLQLYMPVAENLAPHRPLLKLIAVKAVVFLTFWQATGLSILAMFGVVKDTKYMTAEDINTGIAAILETFEMMCFAFLHLRAFSYRPYRDGQKLSDRTPRFRSLMHALDFRDIWREIWDGSIYMGRTVRGVDAEEEFRKRIHFARAMGRERGLNGAKGSNHTWDIGAEPLEEDTLLDSHGHKNRQVRGDMWLSDPGDRFGGAFKDEVERELRQRELDRERHYLDVEAETVDRGHARGQSSWWRSVYDRLSQRGPDRAGEKQLPSIPQRTSYAGYSRKHHRRGSRIPSLDSPPPPASVTFEYPAFGEGSSSVRLSHSHQRTIDVASEARDVGRHHRHHRTASIVGPPCDTPDDGLSTKIQATARTRTIAAPRPLPASQVNHIDLLDTRNEKPLLADAQSSVLGQDSDRIATPSSVLRSDNTTTRSFLTPATNTADGHSSDGGKTNPASSQMTHLTGRMFPPATPFSVDLPSPTGWRAEPFSTPVFSLQDNLRSSSNAPIPLSSSPLKSRSRYVKPPVTRLPERGRARPNIVLPAPLSPVRYPVESPQRGYSPSGIAHRRASQTTIPSQSHAEPLSLTRTKHDDIPSSSRPSDRRSHRRSSAHIEPLARQSPVTTRKSMPVEVYVHSEMTVSREEEARYIPPDSPIGNESAPRLTTTPDASPPFRTLRHSHGDVGKGRRPWS